MCVTVEDSNGFERGLWKRPLLKVSLKGVRCRCLLEVKIPGGLTEEQLRELEELREKAEELEKLKAKLKKKDQQIASLQEVPLSLER